MPSKFLIKLLVSFSLLVLIVLSVDFDILVQETTHSNFSLIGLSVLAVMGQIFFLNCRWHRLLNIGRKKISFRDSLLINLAGFFANTLFITSVGGVIAKSGLAIRYGVSFMHAILVTFFDRFMTLAALLVLTGTSLPFLAHVLDFQIMNMLAVSVICTALMIFIFFAVLQSGMLKGYILSNRRRSRFIATFRNLFGNRAILLKVTFYSLAAQICFIISVYVLSLDMNFTGSPVEFLALLPVLALISSLPISFGGWGVREGAFIYGLGLVGFAPESAFLLSVQVGLVTLVAPTLVSIPFLLNDDWKRVVKVAGA